MTDITKAKVVSVNETTLTVLVIDGDWSFSNFLIPFREGFPALTIVDIMINRNGTKANWPYPK